MTLPPFEVMEPTSLREASEMLAAFGERARVLANGTDLLVSLKKRSMFDVHPPPPKGQSWAGQPHPLAGAEAPEVLISLGRVPGLVGCHLSRTGALVLGPMTTMTELAGDGRVRRQYTALAEGAAAIGAPTIRNRATLGGNLCPARPAADTAGPAIVLDAVMAALSIEGARTVPADDFILAPGRSALDEGEILEAVALPPPLPHQGSAYCKLINRATLEISIVSVAACVTRDGPAGHITGARIAMGAVGPRPLRAPSAEQRLIGAEPTAEVLDEAGRAAVLDASPIDDHRGTAGYRNELIRVLTRRAVGRAAERATAARGGADG